ncbi:AI-2E family transporter [Rubellimicrobium sp. CFH 75288]|uniref:AI-2E family transporter n=1 Tax=Rubellimicrobium sp. CFH 75288 TaxID=2697034 RepID=UPI0014129262|nr:AI-2E family transporter [Rubellimicrobium sp. CFH 75288]
MDPSPHPAPTPVERPGGTLRRPDLHGGLLVAVAVILIVMALRAIGTVLVPVLIGLFTALAIMPVRDRVAALLPDSLRWLGALAAMLVLLAGLGVFVTGITLAARQLVAQSPIEANDVVEALAPTGAGDGDEDLLDAAETGAAEADRQTGPRAFEQTPAAGEDGGAGSGRLGPLDELLPEGTVGDLLRRFGDRVLGAAGGVAAAVLNATTAVIAGLVIVIFVSFLLLLESGQWHRKIQEVTSRHAEWRLLESAEVIAGKVRSYVLVQGAIGLATAALYGIWLWFFDVGLLLVWVSLTFLLTFIPVLGALVAGVLPVAYSLLTQDFGTALVVGLGILAIEQVMGNVVEPRVQGNNIALSPLVVLLSLLFWGWVWGLAGALLAVPVTVSLVVLGAQVPALRPWALLLSDQTDLAGLEETTSRE